jgi:hypothetical protein
MMRILKRISELFRRTSKQSPAPPPLPPPPAPHSRKKLKPSRAARKRKAFERCVRLNPDAPIIQQARDFDRQ